VKRDERCPRPRRVRRLHAGGAAEKGTFTALGRDHPGGELNKMFN
jgi:hypothetical protein